MSTTQLYRQMRPLAINIHRPTAFRKGERVEPAIRLYCTQYATAWTLQVRGPLRIGGGGYSPGKTDIIANASLNREDLTALRDECDRILAEIPR